jgi:hypothetical protein
VLVAFVAAVAVPWLTPLRFASHPTGWKAGASGTYSLTIGPAHQKYPVSVAWTSNVPCRDCDHSNPPSATLHRLGSGGVVVWASIQIADPTGWPPAGRPLSPHYSLTDASHFLCCDGEPVAGGAWELYGFGPRKAYGVLVRVYWGSTPTASMKADAQRALNALELPPARP